jgi:hypothetical protein
MGRVLYALALCLSALLVVISARRPVGSSHPNPDRPHLDAERERITRHLEAVEQRLRAADVTHLTDAQRSARAAHLDVLRDYRLAGRFPHNHGVSAGRVPIFVDDHGTLCAVGYLLARSGETALVAHVASTRNLATVAELADEPGLLEWLEANGLTAEEAGQIQPAYGPPPGQVQQRDAEYLGRTVGLTAASAVTSTWNLLAGRGGDAWFLPGVAGLVSGIASVSWGFAGIDRVRDEDVGPYGTYVTHKPDNRDVLINFVSGAAAAVLGTRTLVLGRSATPGAVADADESPGVMRLELIPTPNGLSGTLRF